MPAAGCRRGLEHVLRDPEQERSREQEGGGVDPVRRVDADCRGERAAGQRPERPREVVHRLEERVGRREILVPDQVGQARVDGRTEEARRYAYDRREDDDLRRVRRERQGDERAGAHQVGADHQSAPREPVDERADEQPDHEGRQQVGDQEPGDPRRGMRPLPDVHLERDEGEPGACTRAQSR